MSHEGEAVGSFYGYKVIGIIKSEQQHNELNSKVKLNGEADNWHTQRDFDFKVEKMLMPI